MRIALVALVLATSTSAFAAEGYWTNSTGEIVRATGGECWHTSSWTPANAVPGCDGVPLTPPPAPAPPPVVATPMDSDKDGVLDPMDKCAETPAGVTVDATGCPLDADKDGVPDFKDKCAETPAGVAVDALGCPPDADVDGVPDYLDKCPATPESVVVDEVGCTKKLDKEVSIGLNVNFVTGKADIEGDASAEIAKVAKFMKQYPDTKVTIEGYTDNVGVAASNKKLSQKRADAVKAALVAGGVDAARLNSVGFGPENPVADNKTDEGRAKNRRVMAHAKAEIQVVEKKKKAK